MKRSLVLVLGLFMISTGVLLASGGKSSSAAFTLAAIGSDPAPIPFTLAPRSTEATALAGPEGAGVIEDPILMNTAVGYWALRGNTGGMNTAIGYQALQSGGGSNNTAVGYKTLLLCTGSYNTATGAAIGDILFWSGSDYSTATGYGALQQNAASYNTATGALAINHVTGEGNTAMGYAALEDLSFGKKYNTALGYRAGAYAGGIPELRGNYNIYIGANQEGDGYDTNTIRIGLPYNPSVDPQAGQNRTFVAGIVENPIDGSLNPSVVGITSDARLGTIPVASLPVGPQGPTGPMGPVGPGLVSGSLLLLHSNVAPPAGYTLLGSTAFLVMQPNRKPTMLNINIYMKQ